MRLPKAKRYVVGVHPLQRPLMKESQPSPPMLLDAFYALFTSVDAILFVLVFVLASHSTVETL